MNEPQFKCGIGLYVLADRALMPTIKQAESGEYIDCEPYLAVDYGDPESLVTALKQALQTGNPPVLDINRKKPPAIQKLAGAKSWADLERKSIYFSVECWDSEFVVTAEGRGSDGCWNRQGDYLFEKHVPLENGIEAVADAILDHLKTRNDLPGLMSASA